MGSAKFRNQRAAEQSLEVEDEIDWGPLDAIKRNDGPETSRRLTARRDMYDSHRWVREALEEPATHAA